MSNTKPPPDELMLACEVCLNEIPASEAISDEATDYVRHFCGLECYELWKKKRVEEE